MDDQDTVLARKVAAGDAAAFALLVRRHEHKVRTFLDRLTRGRDGDDLAQEVFVKAWRMSQSWRAEGSYGGWLMRIAWTTFLSARRSDARRHAREEEGFEPDEGYRPDPELTMDVGRALAGLDDRERGAALLCFGEGYSHSDAAEIMELPLGTLKSIVARARLKLAHVLED